MMQIDYTANEEGLSPQLSALASLDVTLPPEHFEKLDVICPPPRQQPDPILGK